MWGGGCGERGAPLGVRRRELREMKNTYLAHRSTADTVRKVYLAAIKRVSLILTCLSKAIIRPHPNRARRAFLPNDGN